MAEEKFKSPVDKLPLSFYMKCTDCRSHSVKTAPPPFLFTPMFPTSTTSPLCNEKKHEKPTSIVDCNDMLTYTNVPPTHTRPTTSPPPHLPSPPIFTKKA